MQQKNFLEGLEDFQQEIGYNFTNVDLLKQALTHGSSTAVKAENNERLEFFGDAVLELVICELLYEDCPESPEGELTEIKSYIVSRKALAEAAKRIGIREIAVLGKGISAKEELPVSVYANFFEAIVAAVYLDGGLEAVREVSLRLLDKEIVQAKESAKDENYKSLLQEHVQSEKIGDLTYGVISSQGPEHAREFLVGAYVDKAEIGRGAGASKKNAEQLAAKHALTNLTDKQS